MKKIWAGILLVGFLFLCACNRMPASGADNGNVAGAGSSGGTPATAGGAQMVSSVYMIPLYVSSNDGFYESLSINDNGQNIVYTDYETQTRVYLCNRVECGHNDERCTSWFEGYMSLNLVMNPQKTKLFAFRHGIYDEDIPPQIYVMDLNGANRKTLVQFKANESFIDACAADEENLYFAASVTPLDGSTSKKELRQVNMETGEMKTLTSYGASDWLMGAFEDQLIIVSLNPSTMEYVHTAFSLTTQEQREFYRYTVADTSGLGRGNIARIYKDKLYIVEPTAGTKASIHVMDIKTGKQQTLTTELPYYTLDGTFVEDFVDDHMIISVSDNRNAPEILKQYRYILDLSSGQLSEFTLHQPQYTETALDEFVPVYGQNATHYFVQQGTELKICIFTDNAGMPYNAEVPEPVYALIAKEDYWSSTANFIPVHNTIAG